MSIVNYNPQTHFFVDHSYLTEPINHNYDYDAFGPVKSNESIQYRVTSKVRASVRSKVFAICDGNLLIQPQTGNPSKVNIILKPSKPISAPIKIKYFIYRGVNKVDLIDGENIKPLDNSDVNQPVFVKKIWESCKSFNGSLSLPLPTILKASIIGFNPNIQPDNFLIDSLFWGTILQLQDADKYSLPLLKKGDHLGFFTDEIGLDIIIDEGDCQFDYEEQLFKLDLGFARKAEYIFDLSSITDFGKQKKYKEYIHLFIDAAAFWGSHIETGEIALYNVQQTKTSASDIYSIILNKFQTKNKIYLYIQSIRGRSYNFYGTEGQVSFDVQGTNPVVFVDYEQNGWPIIIKDITSNTVIKELQFSFEYKVDEHVEKSDINISAHCFFPDKNFESFITANSLYLLLPLPIYTGQTVLKQYIPIHSLSSVTLPVIFFPTANFYKIITLGNQEQPIIEYYENLWQINLHSPFTTLAPGTSNFCHWAIHTKNRLVNLLGLDMKNTVVNNKVFFDVGKKSDGTNKPRRLFIAAIADTLEASKNLIINTLASGVEKTLSKRNHGKVLYNSSEFKIYKGILEDNGDVPDLIFVNGSDYELKNSYLQLGIVDEEYNKLIYDNEVIPDHLPAIPHIPTDATNIYAHFEEDTIAMNTEMHRKFKLGIKYEDNACDLQIRFPSSPIFVYTRDGIFFYTKEFGEFQEFYEEFAKAKVYFRTLPEYNGEFGFDWLREGDMGEPSYFGTIQGGYERYTNTDTNKQFESQLEAIKFLQREYQFIPMQEKGWGYFTPWLNIYSKPVSNALTTMPSRPYEVELRVLVEIGEPIGKLEFDYDKNYFSLDKQELRDRNISPNRILSIDNKIRITCKKDFSQNKYIKILAYPVGSHTKKDAKLAGQIIVCKNDLINRKELKFVLINVKTNIENRNPEIGRFSSAEKNSLMNILHQTLIDGVLKMESLDLSGFAEYKKFGEYIGLNPLGQLSLKFPDKMYEDLKSRFDHSDGNSKYYNYFHVFSFDINSIDDKLVAKLTDDILHPIIFILNETAGRVLDVGKWNACLFKAQEGREDTTLSHEALHGLGLRHTHDNFLFEPALKYIFPDANDLQDIDKAKATDNIMGYGARVTSWHWQWVIIKSKLK